MTITDLPSALGRVPELGAAIAAVLTDDLLLPRFRNAPNRRRLTGHCYAASEAAFHLLGGKDAGWSAYVVRHEGGTHWYIRHSGGTILDITARQFRTPVPYAAGRRIGFLTKGPSARAREIIRRLSGS
jgi:hypothetical protein